MSVRIVLIGALLSICASTVSASPVRLLLERDTSSVTDEVFQYSLGSHADLLGPSITSSSSGFFDWTLATDISIAALAHDGSGYHMLLERDAPTVTNEVFYYSFDSFSDIQGPGIVSTSSGFMQWTLATDISIAGLAYDGVSFHMLLERDSPSVFDEIFYYSFGSFDDLLGPGIMSTDSGFMQWTLATDISIGGLTYDGSGFHMLLERDNSSVTDEVFYYSFDSFSNLLGPGIMSTDSGFMQWTLATDISISGIATEKTLAAVPLPPGIFGMTVSLTLLGWVARNRPKRQPVRSPRA